MTDWKKAQAKAKDILREYGITSAPVDVFRIAESEGLVIKYFKPRPGTEAVNVSGFLKDNEIYLNAEESRERQAYTLAHELGHHLMHKDKEVEVLYRQQMYAQAKGPIEKEADKFAATLLMPKELIEKAKKEYGLTDLDFEKLAALFGVSRRAMVYRLKNLKRE